MLTKLRGYASKSSDQQSKLLNRLDTLDNKTSRLNEAFKRNEIIGQSILDVLSRDILRQGLLSPVSIIDQLRKDLIQHIYDDNGHQTPDDLPVISDARRRHIEQFFIKRLHYEGMEDREGTVAEAHEETFRWIYEEPKSDVRQWSNFRTWLQSDEQLYWITGKAGSGKSTLLKYICNDPKQRALCLEYLLAWGKGSNILTATYYF